MKNEETSKESQENNAPENIGGAAERSAEGSLFPNEEPVKPGSPSEVLEEATVLAAAIPGDSSTTVGDFEEAEAELEADAEAIVSDEQPESEFEEGDPFAVAYDLEKGDPIAPERVEIGSALPHRAKVRSAREFFSTEILYRHDILLPEDREQLLGTYRVELKGYRGGVWTINLDDDMKVVNRREDADVVIVMQQRDFLGLVNGDLNPQIAVLAKKMRVTGDLKKAIALQALFSPSTD